MKARLLISIELPPGSRLADTAVVTDDITRRRPEIASVFVNGGQLIGNGGKEIRKAALVVNLVHKSLRDRSQRQIESDIAYPTSRTSNFGLSKAMVNAICP